MKRMILVVILVMAVSLVACNNEPSPSQNTIQPQSQMITRYYYLYYYPGMSSAYTTDSYTFTLLGGGGTIYDGPELSYSDKLLMVEDSGDFNSIYKTTGLLTYTQPDEGMGARNWNIRFDAVYPYFYSYGRAEEEDPGFPMYICNAVAVNEHGFEITDEELGYQASLLNGWLMVKYKYETVSINRVSDREWGVGHRDPSAFTLSVMDISDVSDDTKKISSLPALDTRMIGAEIPLNPQS